MPRRFLCVTSAELRNAAEKASRLLAVQPRVHFPGDRPHRRLRPRTPVAIVTGQGFAGLIANRGSSAFLAARGRPELRAQDLVPALSVAIQVKHLQHALSQFEPDALIGQQLCLGPLLLAEVKKLPIAVLGMAAYLWPADPLLAERPAHTEAEGLCLWRYQDMMNWYNQARQLFRMEPSNGSFWQTPLLGGVFMVRSIPELEENIDMLPSRVHLVGPCLWEPPGRGRGLSAWLEQASTANEAVVYVQHGATFDVPPFWPKLVAALAGRPVRWWPR